MDKLNEAVEFTTLIQNAYIDNPEFLYWRGLVLMYKGNTEIGKKYIREALNKDPDNPKYQKTWKNFIKNEKIKKEATDLFQA